jgi:integrase
MVQYLTWDEVDTGRKVWTVAGSKMKGSLPHQVALSNLALEVLDEAKRTTANVGTSPEHGLVFSIDGKPLSGFSKAKGRLDTAMCDAAGKPVPAWTVHDLRRTMTHGLAQLGFPPHVADRILAHTQGTIHGVAAVYNQYEYLDERRDALNAWGNKVETIIGRRPSNVTVLAAR